MMAQDPVKTPSGRRVVLIATAVLALAIGIAAAGIISRTRKEQAVSQWTKEQAIPTVALAKLQRGAAQQTLTLPGNIEPYNKASLYAQGSGLRLTRFLG